MKVKDLLRDLKEQDPELDVEVAIMSDLDPPEFEEGDVLETRDEARRTGINTYRIYAYQKED